MAEGVRAPHLPTPTPRAIAPAADLHAAATLAPPASSEPGERGLDERLRPTLAARSRAESSSAEVAKLVAELTGGLSGAQRATEQLVGALETLRALLGEAEEAKRALAERVGALSRALDESEELARRERQFLTEQQDDFLAALLSEHEEALRLHGDDARTTSLTEELLRAESARALAESERDHAEAARFAMESELSRAHEALARTQRERDALRAEASQLRASLGSNRVSSLPPDPAPPRRPPSFGAKPALSLDDGELDANLYPGGMTPRMPSVVPRFGLPEPAPPAPPSSSPTASATPFPRETTRPGVGPRPPASFGPPPSGWSPPPPADEPASSASRILSAASLPAQPSVSPMLKQKPDPSTRPLIDYSLGEGGVQSELLEGARFPSKPPRR
jgi:hypothetical protein